MNPPIPYTEIRMCFYVEMFLRDCIVYDSLLTGEYSNETLVCDFFRKHLFKTIIEQAAEVEKEYAPRTHEHTLAKLIGRTFSVMIRNVKQVKANDDMVNVHMLIFTPMHQQKPMENAADLRRWVIGKVFTPMQAMCESFAEENKIHGEAYRLVAREIERLIKGDQFTNFTLHAVHK